MTPCVLCGGWHRSPHVAIEPHRAVAWFYCPSRNVIEARTDLQLAQYYLP